MQFDSNGMFGSARRARQLEELLDPASKYLKQNDEMFDSSRRVQRQIDELVNPATKYLKQIEEVVNPVAKYLKQNEVLIDSARHEQIQIEELANPTDKFLMPAPWTDEFEQSLSRLQKPVEEAISPGLQFISKLGPVPKSAVQAMTDDFLQNGPYAHARLADNGLLGVRAMTATIERYQSALGSFDHVVAGMDQIGVGGIPRSVAAHLARDQRDLISYADRYYSEEIARTKWLDDMFAYTSDLETFAQSVRLEPELNLDVFKFGEKLLGRFDETAHRALEHAQTATDRIHAYLSLGADARLLKVPRKIFQRKVRIITRTALTLVPKSAESASQIDREIYRSDLVEDLPRLYARCRTVLAQLRSFVDRALINLYGPSWVQTRVPRVMFAAWAESARNDNITPATGAQWLELADESALVVLITSHWDDIFAYRVSESAPFVDAIRVLGQLRRQMARMPEAMTKFDVLRLSVATTDVAKALHHLVLR